MKKIFFLPVMMAAAFSSLSQNLEPAKNLLAMRKYAEAKEELEKVIVNQSAIKPEVYILKASINSGMLNDGTVKEKNKTDELAATAEAAFKKYQQLDPAMSLLSEPAYQSGLINLYSSFYTLGYNDYTTKNWSAAFSKIRAAVEYSDLLIQKKILSITIDTNLIILAAIISENKGMKDDAAKYYSRLADNQIGGDGFESVYRFLVSYYFQNNDSPAFEKYKSAGAMLYPKSEYFNFDKIDFAVGLENNFNAKIKALEKILATDANGFKANEVLGELIYDTLNSQALNSKLPVNAVEWEKKMVVAFTKAAAAKPGFENPLIYLGDHFINKAAAIGEARDRAKAELNTDAAKTASLAQDYATALFAAEDPYQKAAAIFEQRPTLSNRDKMQYKKVAGYLADIAAYKKVRAKAMSADQVRWNYEETKWRNIAESIK